VRASSPSSFLIGIDRFVTTNPPRAFSRADREIVNLSTSYSKLEYYLSCPFRYQLLFDLGYATPPNPFFSFGRVLHFVLRTAHDAYRDGHPLSEPQVEELFERHFEDVSGVPVLTLNGMRRRGLAALKGYMEHHRSWLEATRETEMPFAYVDEQALGDKTLRVTLSGQADLLINGPSGPHVIDFKSGKPHPYIRTDLQLRLYCLALRQVHGIEVSKATIYYVEHDRAVDYDVSRTWVEEGANEFRSTAAAIASRSYGATPGDVCGRCEVRRLCAYGGRA
jgi:CRISPR/Cas system-associated exonuclease Cas4 (RecB family)